MLNENSHFNNGEDYVVRHYGKYPDDHSLPALEFAQQAQYVSVNMLRKVFCINYEKAISLFADMLTLNWLEIKHPEYSISNNRGDFKYHTWNLKYTEKLRSVYINLLGRCCTFNNPNLVINNYPPYMFDKVLPIGSIYVDNSLLLGEAQTMLSQKFDMIQDFSDENIVKLTQIGNCLVSNCSYDTSQKFLKLVFSKCDPRKADIILYGNFERDYMEFPHIFHLFDFEWLIKERNLRMSSKDNMNQNQDVIGYREIRKLISHNRPIVIVVKELSNMLDVQGAKKSIKDLLINCHQFGITFICFSEFSATDLSLQGIKKQLRVTDTEHIMSSFEKKNEKTSAISLTDIDGMDGVEFERFCMNIIMHNGFTNVRMTETTSDYGGDILAEKDQIKYVIQCKRYMSSVGVSAVQEVIGSRVIYNCHVGVVLTNNYFTKNAEVLAEKTNVLLWNRKDLSRLLQQSK